jgi:CDP-diacylglycerol--glycerol-3-phosphate 3-phosphatidyltransferase
LVRNIPNLLTFVRLGLIPIFVLLMLDPTKYMVFLAILVFIFAALTDYADGFLARKFGAVSDFGKLLDPLADKILVMAALVMLAAQRSDLDGKPWINGGLVVLVLARELWVTGLRGIAASRGIILPAGSAGKLKSGLQMCAIVLLLLHDTTFPIFGLRFSAQFIGTNLLILSLLFAYWGAVDYTQGVIEAGGLRLDGVDPLPEVRHESEPPHQTH